ncbi:hypothetical protein SLS55_007646 [Diplodia seriata]|uniref:Transcription factor domain-containing protein n=1 Tax=Diplodia seriata TaxID=420778 RepID=A0ABR3C859_9PEZI
MSDLNPRSERLERLEGQLARLTDVVEGLRGDVTDLANSNQQSAANRSGQSHDRRPTPNPTPSTPSVAHGDSVAREGITEDECVRLFETFLARCHDTIATFDAIPETLDAIRQEPILLAVVCAVGARAADPEGELHQRCLAEAQSLTSSMAFGPPPSLLALRAVMLICAWYRFDRLWGSAITIAYEMGLHKEARRLTKEAGTMDRDEIERARTWLSIVTYELMANTSSRPYLVDNSQSHAEQARGLMRSPHSRPVDQRIMVYLELFEIIVNAKNTRIGELGAHQRELRLVSFNASLEGWFHRVHNSIDPLYQTFSQPQDRNRLDIPYAFARLYINGRVLDAGIIHDGATAPEKLALRAVDLAVDSAFILLTTALDSQALAESLPYTIDYSSMTLTTALSFLSRVVPLRHSAGHAVDVDRIVATLQRAREAFERARAFSLAEWTQGLIGECVAAA